MNMLRNQFQESPEENLSMATSTQKKKRTHPDPNADVIALSPKTLMTTNRFICEVCKKGFQREQNLQLHRRGHNLPWKLKQKSTKDEVKKKIYLCPEPTCVHHHPSRALGDLTGIKKHFYRKHGEKKWKCEKCSKMYAVQSDWRAHSKTCGTKEYRCECGTLFSRRDSFVTHQAFCDAIGREYSTNLMNSSIDSSQLYGPSRGINNQGSPCRQGIDLYAQNTQPSNNLLAANSMDGFRYFSSLIPPFNGSAVPPNYSSIVFDSPNYQENHPSPSNAASIGMIHQVPKNQVPSEHCGLIKGNLDSDQGFLAGLFSSDKVMGDQISHVYRSASAHLSATELLQKAAQVGSSRSANGSSSFHTSLGSILSSSRHDIQASLGSSTSFGALLCDQNNKHLHELMSSLGGSTASLNEIPPNKEAKPSYREYNTDNIASSDMLTRDFMGVGQIVRQMSHGRSQNDPLSGYQQRSLGELDEIDNMNI